MSVSPPEDDGLDEERDGGCGPGPYEGRVRDSGDQDLAQSAGQGRHEQEDGDHGGPHVLGGSSVRELVGRHVHEDLGNGAEGDVRDLPPDADGRDVVTSAGLVSAVF